MKKNISIRCIVWSALGGIAAAIALLLLYPLFPNAVFKILASVDRLAMLVASSATRTVFRGDRVAYTGLKDVTFFNIVVILVTGFQTALLGGFVGGIFSRKRAAKTCTVGQKYVAGNDDQRGHERS